MEYVGLQLIRYAFVQFLSGSTAFLSSAHFDRFELMLSSLFCKSQFHGNSKFTFMCFLEKTIIITFVIAKSLPFLRHEVVGRSTGAELRVFRVKPSPHDTTVHDGPRFYVHVS